MPQWRDTAIEQPDARERAGARPAGRIGALQVKAGRTRPTGGANWRTAGEGGANEARVYTKNGPRRRRFSYFPISISRFINMTLMKTCPANAVKPAVLNLLSQVGALLIQLASPRRARRLRLVETSDSRRMGVGSKHNGLTPTAQGADFELVGLCYHGSSTLARMNRWKIHHPSAMCLISPASSHTSASPQASRAASLPPAVAPPSAA